MSCFPNRISAAVEQELRGISAQSRDRYRDLELAIENIPIADVRDTPATPASQTVIEDGDMGRAIVQDLRRTGEPNVIVKKPRFDKQARFLMQSVWFESRQIYAPSSAPWYADWLDELLQFPNGKHDDQVDSTSQALEYLARRTGARNVLRQPGGPGRPAQRPSSSPRPHGQNFLSSRRDKPLPLCFSA